MSFLFCSNTAVISLVRYMDEIYHFAEQLSSPQCTVGLRIQVFIKCMKDKFYASNNIYFHESTRILYLKLNMMLIYLQHTWVRLAEWEAGTESFTWSYYDRLLCGKSCIPTTSFFYICPLLLCRSLRISTVLLWSSYIPIVTVNLVIARESHSTVLVLLVHSFIEWLTFLPGLSFSYVQYSNYCRLTPLSVLAKDNTGKGTLR